jgi:hypothetical protein
MKPAASPTSIQPGPAARATRCPIGEAPRIGVRRLRPRSRAATAGIPSMALAAIAAMPMLLAAVSNRGVEVPYGTP